MTPRLSNYIKRVVKLKPWSSLHSNSPTTSSIDQLMVSYIVTMIQLYVLYICILVGPPTPLCTICWIYVTLYYTTNRHVEWLVGMPNKNNIISTPTPRWDDATHVLTFPAVIPPVPGATLTLAGHPVTRDTVPTLTPAGTVRAVGTLRAGYK